MSLLVELPRMQIDIKKWDKLIEKSTNGLIYHTSGYLDMLSKNWSALIFGDYEFVLPLTHKKILGFRLLQQPSFLQQLGIIGNDITDEIMQIFFEYLNANFDYIAYSLNFENQIFYLKKKKNYIISLNESYNNLSHKFSSDVKSNINKSLRNKFIYTINLDFKKTIDHFRKLYGKRFRHVKDKVYTNLSAFCQNHVNSWISREVYLENQLCASVLLLKDSKRIYLIINTVSQLGRNTEANYFMLDQLIREFAESNLILDFEGSDLPGVAEFYEKFGATDQAYYEIKNNRLPFYLKFFKK